MTTERLAEVAEWSTEQQRWLTKHKRSRRYRSGWDSQQQFSKQWNNSNNM